MDDDNKNDLVGVESSFTLDDYYYLINDTKKDTKKTNNLNLLIFRIFNLYNNVWCEDPDSCLFKIINSLNNFFKDNNLNAFNLLDVQNKKNGFICKLIFVINFFYYDICIFNFM